MIHIAVERVGDLAQKYGYGPQEITKPIISLLGRKFLINKFVDLGLSFDFTIAVQEKGKPFFLNNPDAHFSISNTRDFIAIAYGDQAVGADIEGVRIYKPALVSRFFHPQEANFLKQLQDPQTKDHAFTQLWTMKEAMVKLSGEGIANNLNKIPLIPNNWQEQTDCHLIIDNIEIKSHYLRDFNLYLSTACYR